MATDTQKITGIGRVELERRLEGAQQLLVELRQRIIGLEREAEAAKESERLMCGTLTHAQELATKYLGVARAVRAIGDYEIMQDLAPLGAAIERARSLHPAGCALRMPCASATRGSVATSRPATSASAPSSSTSR
jgi:hypothetical protein